MSIVNKGEKFGERLVYFSKGKKFKNMDKGENSRDFVEGELCIHIAFVRMHFRGSLSF